jgi:hypothetical protein
LGGDGEEGVIAGDMGILTITKLLNQFEHVLSATPFALKLLGNISDGIAHGTGPHVAPKLSI